MRAANWLLTFGSVRLYAERAWQRLSSSGSFEGFPAGVLTARPDGRIEYCNAFWRMYTAERRVRSIAGVLRCVPDDDSAEFSSSWDEGVAGRSPFVLHARLRRHDGDVRWHRFAAQPLLCGRDVPVKWMIVVTDVHEEIEARRAAERASQRLKFLSEAGRALHESFEPREVALAACAQAVNWIAVRASMRLRYREEMISVYAPESAADDSLMESLLRDDEQAMHPVTLFEGLDDEVTYVAMAVGARTRVLGRLVLAVPLPVPSSEDVVLLEEFSHRVGVALDNARMYGNERLIATTLQAQLLPSHLHEPYAMNVNASYFACEDETRVGGDWYDAFELHDGRLALTVGDVAGHGVVAAAMMGKLRHTIRAALLDGATPAKALALANNVVCNGEPEVTTAFAGIIDTIEMTLQCATAGHLPPVLMREGAAEFVEIRGAALGVLEQLELRDYIRALPERGALVLYTDGLVEYAHDLLAGMEHLQRTLGRHAADCMRLNAQQLSAEIIGDNPRNDDAAMLVVCFEPVREIDMTMPASPSQAEMARRTLLRFAHAWGIDKGRADDMALASCEALNNAIEHAYTGQTGSIRLRAKCNARNVVVTVSDAGRWDDRQPYEDRGRGIRIMRALSEEVEIQRAEAGTSVCVTFVVVDSPAAR